MTDEKDEKSKAVCGIVMPISTIDGCDENHWSDVREILEEAIDSAGLTPNLVSNADDIGIIQKRIIQNLYENPIVVCDVSGKNPNVMFELGMRLAFDKPTVIVKDDKTQYSFDTSPIEHLSYPRDLRFSKIVEFKEQLKTKLTGTLKAATDPKYTTFLKHFGTFQVAKLESKEVSGDKLILEEIQELRRTFSDFRRREHDRSGFTPDQAGEIISRVSEAIKEFAQTNGLRSKAKVREAESDIRRHVLRTIDAPRYFPHRRQFDEFFESVFATLYS